MSDGTASDETALPPARASGDDATATAAIGTDGVGAAVVTSGQGAVCHNCGTPLHGRFCAACGQEAKPLNPRLRDIVRDLIEELLEVDGRIFRSVRGLFLSPGFLTREQFLGRRVSWLGPLRLYLLFSVLYFALASFTDTNIVTVNRTPDKVEKTASGAEQTAGKEEADSLKSLGFENEEALRRALRDTQQTWLPRIMFLLVPVFAGIVALVRRRSDMSYPLHVYFALHVHAAWFGVSAIGAATRIWQPAVADMLDGIRVVYMLIYVYAGLRTAYGVSRRRAAIDTAIIAFAYWVVVIAAMLTLFLLVLAPWRRM